MDASSTESRNQRWTSDKETRLIGLYERHRLLWDSRHPHYRDRDRRERAMSNIAQGLQDEFDVVSVKNKIKWLRDYFVKGAQEGTRRDGEEILVPDAPLPRLRVPLGALPQVGLPAGHLQCRLVLAFNRQRFTFRKWALRRV
ncbi:hypothetical protein MTO96_036686 [Rhipicephalus appendiculatus]